MIGVIKSDGWWRFACGDVLNSCCCWLNSQLCSAQTAEKRIRALHTCICSAHSFWETLHWRKFFEDSGWWELTLLAVHCALCSVHRCTCWWTLTGREVAQGGAFKLAHENSWRLYPDCTSISLPCTFFARILIFPSFAAANVHTRKLHKAMSMSTRATLDKMHMQMMSIIMLPIDFRSKCHCQTIFNYSV